MKGILHKTEQGWIVEYAKHAELPLHPEFIEMMDTCFTSKFNQEVEFEIVTEWENGEVGVNGLTYAKLIKEEKPFIDNRKDKLETLAKLLAKTWFYCDWKWESPNERVMQMLMQDLGLYPFKNEDEMIQQTKIDDGLDKELYKEASRRIPTYGKLSADLVENKPDLTKMEQKLDDALANETSESLEEWMLNKREIHNYKLGLDDGYNKAKETLFTEEDIFKALFYGYHTGKDGFDVIDTLEYGKSFIQSLKQPKQ